MLFIFLRRGWCHFPLFISMISQKQTKYARIEVHRVRFLRLSVQSYVRFFWLMKILTLPQTNFWSHVHSGVFVYAHVCCITCLVFLFSPSPSVLSLSLFSLRYCEEGLPFLTTSVSMGPNLLRSVSVCLCCIYQSDISLQWSEQLTHQCFFFFLLLFIFCVYHNGKTVPDKWQARKAHKQYL